MLSQDGLIPLLLGLALAAAVDPEVTEGLELYRSLKYDRAVVVLGRALAKTNISDEDRHDALETLGFAYIVLGDEINAELTFHTLLDTAPSYAPDGRLSPRLRDAITAAKSSWSRGRAIQFRLTSSLAKNEIAGELEGGDPRRVGSVRTRELLGATAPVYCKARGCRGERPGGSFYIDVLDHAGTILHTSGPHEPELSPEATPWWIYAAIVAGVVGGGIAIAVATSGGEEAPPGSLGKLQLP
jgi:hypothetical protein